MAPPPVLVEDAIAEILLRVPPEEPAQLIRASLVCKLWRRILCNPDFLRHYRRYHRTPPLLGFFHHVHCGSKRLQRFVPAMASSPFSPLVAIASAGWSSTAATGASSSSGGPTATCSSGIQSPATGRSCASPPTSRASPPRYSALPPDATIPTAAVGFDHMEDWRAHACVYSSRVGAWGEHVHFDIGYPWGHTHLSRSRAAHIGDEIYFYFGFHLGPRILKYDLLQHCLSEINLTVPDMDFMRDCEVAIMPTEEGLLGLAVARDSNLYLCSRMVNAEGVAEWVQCRVIELHSMLHDLPNAIGFAEGLNVLFVNKFAGLFTMDLNSEEARKVGERGINYFVLPVMSFYTPDCACSEVSISRIGKLITSQPK